MRKREVNTPNGWFLIAHGGGLNDRCNWLVSSPPLTLEIIVVDDVSTDGTRETLTRHSPHITYLYQENRGVSAARNLGVSKANGKLLAFLDSDDLWAPGKLMAQLNTLISEDTLSFHGVEWFVDCQQDSYLLERKAAAKWPRCQPDGFVADPVLDVAEGCYLQIGTLLCLKEAFQRIGHFEEGLSMGEDEDWFSRAASKMKFHYTAAPLLRIRYHAYQTSQDSEKSIRSLIRDFEGMKARTHGLHSAACAASNERLAAKWSHLANKLHRDARQQEAGREPLSPPFFGHQPIHKGF